MLRKVLPVISFVCLPLFVFSQLSISAVKTTFTVDFNNTVSDVNNGTFIAPATVAAGFPFAGQLDRDAFQISSSAGTGFNWPVSPVDVTGGKTSSNGGASQAGIYAYSNDGGTNRLLGVNPNGSNFTPGAIILKVQNNSGSTITQFDLSYTAYAYNIKVGSTSLTLYYSSDGSTWFAADAAFNYTSPGASSAAWESATLADCIPALNIADGGYFYLKWVIDGSGSMDEIGIDDITLLGRTPLVGFTTSSSIVAELDPDGTTTQSYLLDVYMEAPPIGGNLVFGVSTTDGTATSPDDFTALSGFPTLTFLQTDCYPVTKMVMLNLKKDTDIETNEDFDVTLTLNSGSAPTGILTHTVTIANDDPGGSITLYSRLTMGAWSDSGMWSTQRNGGLGTVVPDPNNLIGSSGPEYNMVIQPGHTVTLDGDKGINTIEIEKSAMDGSIKGKLYVNSTSTVHYLQVYGNSVDIDGTIGNGDTRDGVSLEFQGASCNLTGSGDIDLFRIRKDGNQDTDLDIQTNVNLRGTGCVFYNNADGYSFNPIIFSGDTVTATVGNVSIDGEDGTSNRNSKGIFTINGMLDIDDGHLYLKTNNPTAITDDITYSIGASGVLKVRGSVFGNDGNSGAAIARMNIASGGELQLLGINDLFVDYSSSRNNIPMNSNVLINFAGGFAQNIPSLPFYGDLTLSGGGDKTLQANTTVLGTLNLVSGNLILDSYDLTINLTGDIIGGDDDSYVQTNSTGALIQNVDGLSTYLFPVGNSSYNPATLANFGTTDNFSVRVVDQVQSNGTFGNTLTEDVVNRTWLIDEENDGGSSLTMILQWFTGDELPGFDRTNCYIGHYINGIWEESNVPTASQAENGGYVLTASGVDEFSPFVVAKAGVVLPVELAYFRAYAKRKTAILEWSTLSELNNALFVIERSGDLRSFEEIGTIDGQGNSQIQHDYSFTDTAPFPGINYYRLKQIDFDGSYYYSDIETVKFETTGIQLWPNPVKTELNFALENPSNHIAELNIFSISGRKIRAWHFPQLPDQLSVEDLPSGHYFLEIRLGDVVERVRFVKF